MEFFSSERGLYTPRVNPYGMVLGEVPAIFWVHGHLGFHMEWSWNGHGMINSIWNDDGFHACLAQSNMHSMD